ncbi:adenylate/guanylate cyclase domain-containing protein [Reyranella sp.]|uniref:adenylate/guanylate cyclase domain-containing protein n=1 Tax=Reyranella sp. TaxID=1929291 RepID=UPI0025E1A1A3|nr:adenylate/guanylate cyclase domain-containing protein [Reyranella sp.]
MAREQRRLAAIVSSDLAGYSRLMAEDESGTLAALKAARREVVDPSIAQHGGRIVKTTGDGLLLEFASAVDAVRSTIETQLAMAAFNADRPKERRLDFRIGVNVGDIIIDDDDIFGDGVNVAARLQEIAKPGGVCLSDFVHQEVRGRINAKFDDLGELRVKNIARPVRAWAVRIDAQSASIPPRPASDQAPMGERASRPSLAILSFDHMGGDADTEALCKGLSEDLITALSRFRWMRVTSRVSSVAYGSALPDVRQVASELGVRYVLEGSVRRVAKRVRINAQLIDASSGSHVWARRYDREIADPFDLQDEVIRDVVGGVEYALWHVLVRGEGKPPDPNVSPLRAAGWHITQVTAEDARAAIMCSQRALVANSRSVAAYQYTALAYSVLMRCGWSVDFVADAAAGLEATRQATRLSPGDALSHGLLAYALCDIGDAKNSIEAARRALELDSNSVQALGPVALTTSFVGDPHEALKLMERVLDLAPAHYGRSNFVSITALVHWKLRNVARAVALADEGADLQRDSLLGPLVQAVTLVGAGRLDDARAALTRARALRPDLSPAIVRGVVPFADPADRAAVLDALRQAGLDSA